MQMLMYSRRIFRDTPRNVLSEIWASPAIKLTHEINHHTAYSLLRECKTSNPQNKLLWLIEFFELKALETADRGKALSLPFYLKAVHKITHEKEKILITGD